MGWMLSSTLMLCDATILWWLEFATPFSSSRGGASKDPRLCEFSNQRMELMIVKSGKVCCQKKIRFRPFARGVRVECIVRSVVLVETICMWHERVCSFRIFSTLVPRVCWFCKLVMEEERDMMRSLMPKEGNRWLVRTHQFLTNTKSTLTV